MNYSSQQLPNGRWGIYQADQLLATVGCDQTCKEILMWLQLRDTSNSNTSRYISSLTIDTSKQLAHSGLI